MASRLITDLDSCHAYLEKLKGACSDESYQTILSQQSKAWQRKLAKVKLSTWWRGYRRVHGLAVTRTA